MILGYGSRKGNSVDITDHKLCAAKWTVRKKNIVHILKPHILIDTRHVHIGWLTMTDPDVNL